MLEHELGVTLFTRHNRQIQLTEQGKVFYERAKEILQLVDSTEKEFKEASDGLSGVLSIACIDSLSSKLLPERISAFQDKYPGVHFRIWSGDPNEVMDLVENQLVELGIVRLPILDHKKFEIIKLYKEPIVIAMHESRNIGGSRDYITLDELEGMPIACIGTLKQSSTYRHQSVSEMIVDVCHQKGFKPQIICESNDIMTLLTMAKYDIGITAIPKSAANLVAGTEIVFKEIREPFIMSRESALIWRKGSFLSTVSKNFIDSFPLEKGGGSV